MSHFTDVATCKWTFFLTPQKTKDLTFYLGASRPPGTGRMLHSRPMSSFPLYVPPKLRSSATAKPVKRPKMAAKRSCTTHSQTHTWDHASVVADVVPKGLPVVFILWVVEGVKCDWESWRQILHQHLDLLIDQSASWVGRQVRWAGPRHGGQPSAEGANHNIYWEPLFEESVIYSWLILHLTGAA